MKRVASIIAIMTASALLFAGCSGTASSAKTETQDAAAATSSVESVVTDVSDESQKEESTAATADESATDSATAVAELPQRLADQVDVSLHASIQHETDSPEWVKNLDVAMNETVNQIFVVAGLGMDQTTATVSMHQRDEEGNWKQILSTPAFVGKNGLCPDADHAEGCGQTPIGEYHFNKAFGIAPDPGCAIPYTQVTDDTYWSGDSREGMHYNEMVSFAEFPDLDMENSEHIVDYEYQYQYCLNISFNEDGTAGRGSAIFLHCFGPTKPYTGGCVALPENIMRTVMEKVDPNCVVVINTLENMGGAL